MWGNMLNKLPIIPSYDDWGWVTKEGCQPCPRWISKPVLSRKKSQDSGQLWLPVWRLQASMHLLQKQPSLYPTLWVQRTVPALKK